LHDFTGSWTTPLFMLIGVSFVIFISGIEAGKEKVIGETVSEEPQTFSV